MHFLASQAQFLPNVHAHVLLRTRLSIDNKPTLLNWLAKKWSLKRDDDDVMAWTGKTLRDLKKARMLSEYYLGSM